MLSVPEDAGKFLQKKSQMIRKEVVEFPRDRISGQNEFWKPTRQTCSRFHLRCHDFLQEQRPVTTRASVLHPESRHTQNVGVQESK